MKDCDSITIHDQYAAEYDDSVCKYGSYAAEILFGLSYEYVEAQERLLDVGIGTGLSSVPFAKAGLEIFGLEGSAAMLEICRTKGFARELKLWDVRYMPWPYPDDSFDHVLACGLFHFLGELAPFFAEAGRLLRIGGAFAFSVMHRAASEMVEDDSANFAVTSRSDLPIFIHYDNYIESLVADNGLTLLKKAKFLLWGGEGNVDDTFQAYVVRSMGER
jgi:predicted TPR repeat methyltransferase